MTDYLSNPYFDGVISPITTQGEVTLNCRAEHGEIAQRRANMSRNEVRAFSYPGGKKDPLFFLSALHLKTKMVTFYV